MGKTISVVSLIFCLSVFSQVGARQNVSAAPKSRPDSAGWPALFKADLSDAVFPAGIWTFQDGVLTASEDQCIWTAKD